MNNIQIAVDLGTTNIEIALVDGLSQSIISSKIIKNRQSLYGSDVINRIAATIRDKKHLYEMRQFVLSDLKDAFETMLEDKDYKLSQVGNIFICGNTTMISILLELDIDEMGQYPFNHALCKSQIIDSCVLFGDTFSKDTKVFFSGCVSAFIGGDILSGIYYLEKSGEIDFDKEKNSLFIDMGTNGEIIFNHKGLYYGTSTACGPAFEGCTRKQSVYGYSTIDAISLGINSKAISRQGVLSDEYKEKGLHISGVHLDMNIIEQIMVAKAGIYTGMCMLVRYAGVTLESIDKVYIAGGFGFNLKIDSAINIGLLPECFDGKVKTLGNTSLKGATLLAKEDLTLPNPIDNYHIDILELANDKEFQNELIDNMSFVRK